MRLPKSTGPLRNNLKPLVILFGVFLLTFGIAFSPGIPAWDAAFYYTYARSAVLDGDQHLENDLLALNSYLPPNNPFTLRHMEQQNTTAGYVMAYFPIGVSVLWLPWLVFANELGHFIKSLPLEVLRVWLIGIASATMGWLMLYLSYRLTRRVATSRSALIAAIMVGLASPFVYYQLREPLYAHTASALITGLLLIIWWPSDGAQDLTLGRAAAIGAMIGFTSLVRWQSAIYLVLPLYSAAKGIRDGGRKQLPQVIRYLLILGIVTVLCFAPQLAHWYLFFGKWLTVPQGDSFMEWNMAFLIPTLFSPLRGLLFWMPVFFLALTGLLRLMRSKSNLAIPLLLVITLSLYVNGSVRDWFAGGGYGPRRFISELPILIIGLAILLDWFPRRIRTVGSLFLAGGLILHQWLLLHYGLADSIGGRIITKYPDFRWQDASALDFRQWLGYIPRALTNPVQTLVFENSPVDWMIHGSPETVRFFTIAVAAIGSTLAVAALLALAWYRLKPRIRYSLLGFMITCGCAVITLWLLTLS
jgi:hypothetical protein